MWYSGGVTLTADEMGRKGGKARAANMTKAERSEAARMAVQARWARTKAKGAKATTKGKK